MNNNVSGGNLLFHRTGKTISHTLVQEKKTEKGAGWGGPYEGSLLPGHGTARVSVPVWLVIALDAELAAYPCVLPMMDVRSVLSCLSYIDPHVRVTPSG